MNEENHQFDKHHKDKFVSLLIVFLLRQKDSITIYEWRGFWSEKWKRFFSKRSM